MANTTQPFIKFSQQLPSRGSTLKTGVIASLVVVAIGLVGFGAYQGRQKLWWFTQAYDSRRVTNEFMGDVLKGDTTNAYNQTSQGMQQVNSPDKFQADLAVLKNPKAKVTATDYKVKDSNSVVVVGTLTDPTTKEIKLFGVTVVKYPGKQKIDTLIAIDSETNTADARTKLLASLASAH